MDYEKIKKNPPQGSGGGPLSPVKLRSMLKKKKKQGEDQLESTTFSLGSQISDIDDSGDSCLENYKDVDVVSVLPNHLTASPFEFQKTERAPHRKPLAPFSKPAPSKWDDAQKWIASPTSNRPKTDHSLKKNSHFSHGNRQPTSVNDQRLVPYAEPDDSYSKSVVMIEECAVNLSQHDSSVSIESTTFVPPVSTARSVSMRDMGTEMTPIASQEPSRTATPVRATTPSRSPERSDDYKELSEKELQIKTRREIKALGTQLGKMNIAAWASKEDEEDKDLGAEKRAKSAIEMRAEAWEDAEKAKYLARFKREEIKIEAWENHQKAKTEAEMRRIEVEVERMRGGAHDRLMKKLTAARHEAEQKLAAAEAKRNRQAARTEEQAQSIRKTGRIPFSFSCYHCYCCF